MRSRNKDFKDRVAIVTGASSGIGQSLATKLQEAGARVVLTARSTQRLERLSEVLKKQGGDNLVCTADMTKAADIQRLVDETIKHYGRIDILVNNAGAGFFSAVANVDLDAVRSNFELNFFGPVELMLKVYPFMVKAGGGAIVNISSTAGIRSFPGAGYYCATKHALNAVSEAFALEAATTGVHVLTVMPGTTNTGFFPNAVNAPEKLRANPPQDMTPDEVAIATLNALRNRRKRIVLTRRGRVMGYLNRLSPALVDRVLARTQAEFLDEVRRGV